MKRRVAAIDGSGQFVLIEEDVPQPGPGEVLVENRVSLISPGTELGGVLQSFSYRPLKRHSYFYVKTSAYESQAQLFLGLGSDLDT